MSRIASEARARLAERRVFDDDFVWEKDFNGEHRLYNERTDTATAWRADHDLAVIADRFVIPGSFQGLTIPVQTLLQYQRLPTLSAEAVGPHDVRNAYPPEHRVFDDGYEWEKDGRGNHRLFNRETAQTTLLLKQRALAVLGDRLLIPEFYQGQDIALRSLLIWRPLPALEVRQNL